MLKSSGFKIEKAGTNLIRLKEQITSEMISFIGRWGTGFINNNVLKSKINSLGRKEVSLYKYGID